MLANQLENYTAKIHLRFDKATSTKDSLSINLNFA